MIGELVLMTGVVVSQEEMIGELVLMTGVVSQEERGDGWGVGVDDWCCFTRGERRWLGSWC